MHAESRAYSLELIPILEAAGRTKAARMELHVLCHALRKLERWDELDLWADRLLADAEIDGDWKSQALALEYKAQYAEALRRPEEAVRALEAERMILQRHAKRARSSIADHLHRRIERLRAEVEQLGSETEPIIK